MPATNKTTGLKTEADVFNAIAHPARRQILDALVSGDRTVNQLAEPFEDKTRSAISQHLKILLDSGLVDVEKRGRERFYRLKPDNLNQVYAWVRQYEQLWPEKLKALGAYLDTIAAQDEGAGADEG